MPVSLSNYEPSLVLNPVIQTQGTFPPRDGGPGYMSDTLGQIHFLATSYTGGSSRVADLNGALLPISSNTALFSLLGTYYGGDGKTNFALPDLGDRISTGFGGYFGHDLGESYGTAVIDLTQANLAPSSGGSFQPGDNQQPAVSIGWYINVAGIYPTESGGSPAMLGAVNLFAGGFAPSNTLPCDGRLLQISENEALFSILGTTYGGNGITTFALPDLRGRSPVGVGSNYLGTFYLGEAVGSETFSLNQYNMPASMGGYGLGANNRAPGLVLTPLIAIEGLFTGFDEYDPTLAEITWFAGSRAPGGYAIASGQLLSISQNTALFSLIGTTYGGNGQTTFALPDLTGRVALGDGGGHLLGESFGAETFTVTDAAIPGLNFSGDGGDNTLYGGPLGDTINGAGGNDTIYGNGGPDAMSGGPGNDTFYVDNAADVVTEANGEGTDTVRTTLASYALTGPVENLVGLLGTGQTLDGNGLDNAITGGSGGDTLRGYGGNDTLDGGAGADAMYGYNGDDTFVVDNAGDSVVEYAGQGIDTVRTSLASYTLGGNLENLVGLVGTGQTLNGNALDNTITGGAGADTLRGYAGNDTLDGGAGPDTMFGYNGNDTYYVDLPGDVVVEYASQGIDTVRTTLASYTLGGNLENLVGLLGTAQALNGNALDNAITGGAAGDTLRGYGGNDTLDGGAGADAMFGDNGDDTFIVDNAGDTVIEYAGQGVDTVRTTLASYILGGNVERLVGQLGTGQTLEGNALDNTITGGAGADTLRGYGGNDTLDGGAGADSLYGYNGDDIYLVDTGLDLVVEYAGQGTDAVVTAVVNFSIPANVEILIGAFSGGQTITGNGEDNWIFLGSGNDVTNGAGGSDLIDGGAGSDTMWGDVGNDTFSFSTALGPTNIDLVQDFASGVDKLQLSSAIFTGLGVGVLPDSAFHLGTTAHDADDRIIYDQASGKLWFDADGNGAGAAVQFATLGSGSHPAIVAGDFAVV